MELIKYTQKKLFYFHSLLFLCFLCVPNTMILITIFIIYLEADGFEIVFYLSYVFSFHLSEISPFFKAQINDYLSHTLFYTYSESLQFFKILFVDSTESQILLLYCVTLNQNFTYFAFYKCCSVNGCVLVLSVPEKCEFYKCKGRVLYLFSIP